MIAPAEKKLLAFVDRDELVALTCDLVRIDSVIRPETGVTERDVVAYLESWIRRELGVELPGGGGRAGQAEPHCHRGFRQAAGRA